MMMMMMMMNRAATTKATTKDRQQKPGKGERGGVPGGLKLGTSFSMD